MICDDDVDPRTTFSLRTDVKCNPAITDDLTANDFKLSYDRCQYKVEVTHAAGCPIDAKSNTSNQQT